MDWNNRSVGDILPTYRWMIENEGENSLKADFDVADAWYGEILSSFTEIWKKAKLPGFRCTAQIFRWKKNSIYNCYEIQYKVFLY